MKKQLLLNKQALKGLYGKLIFRLTEINKQDRFIEWAIVYKKIGAGFSVKKEEIRELVFFLRDLGFCDISCRGVKLKFKVIE
jgi:hypothetical protein